MNDSLTPFDINDPVLTLTEAAAHCRINPVTLRMRVKAGIGPARLPCAGIDRLLFAKSEIQRWLRSPAPTNVSAA